MKRNIIGFSLFVVLSLTLMSISAIAQATSSTTTERIPISGTFTACNGEDVVYEGTANVVQHFTVSSSGQVNIKIGSSLNIKGVGQTTGAKYVANQSVQQGQRFDSIDLAPFNLTVTGHLNFNGQGGVPNTKVRILQHFTINANGDLTSSKLEFTSECN